MWRRRIMHSLALRGRNLLGKGFRREFFEEFYESQGPDAWSYARNAYHQERFEFIVESIPPGPVDRALEIGCAEGQMTAHLARRASSVVAADGEGIRVAVYRRASSGPRRAPGGSPVSPFATGASTFRLEVPGPLELRGSIATVGGPSPLRLEAKSMKLLWIGYFRDTRDGDRCDEQRMARGLERAGVDVSRCDAPWDDAERRLAIFSPDWVLFSKCREFTRNRLERLRAAAPGIPFGQLLFDLMDHSDRVLPGVPWPMRSRLSWWLPLASLFDLVFMRELGHFDRYAELGVRCVYLDQACDPEEPPVDHVPERCDVAFFGNYYPSRGRALRALGERHDVRVFSIYPSPWKRAGFRAHPAVFGTAFAEAVASARIVYGESVTHEVEGYWSDRVYRVLGRRGFFLTRYTPGLERSFHNHEHLVWYEKEEELPSLAARYLADAEERGRIAESGFRHVRRHHTYDHRARELIDVLRRSGRRSEGWR